MASQADERGRFRFDTTVLVGPANVRVVMLSGTGRWTLGPVPVVGSGMICKRKDDDD
jgi:hypothetical protein